MIDFSKKSDFARFNTFPYIYIYYNVSTIIFMVFLKYFHFTYTELYPSYFFREDKQDAIFARVRSCVNSQLGSADSVLVSDGKRILT